ncbi:hypothetical protein A7983_09955 [Pectobacterium wasabiae CFBP 3304]|nr:hypothetical protein A7983_09955 [Pectobacterium wasabiae CFBP 3304]
MINKVINKTRIAHGFEKKHEAGLTSFYMRESSSAHIRKLHELSTPANLDTEISQSTHGAFLSHPAFKENCNFIHIHRLSGHSLTPRRADICARRGHNRFKNRHHHM